MAFSEVIPFDTVRSNNLGIYQVELSNWGNIGTGADPNSLQSPEFKFPLGGSLIDPESRVERFILRPSVNGVVSNSGILAPSDIPVGRDPLLSGRFSFPRVKGFTGGWGVVCGQSERWGDSMRTLTGTFVPFGGVIGTPQVFVKPTLKLVLLTDSGLPLPSVSRRAPLRFSNIYNSFIGAGQDHRLFWLPILGRKSVRVTCIVANGAVGALKVRGVVLGGEASSGAMPQEITLAPDAALPTATAVSVLVTNPLCHFLEVVVQQDAGATAVTYVEADD